MITGRVNIPECVYLCKKNFTLYYNDNHINKSKKELENNKQATLTKTAKMRKSRQKANCKAQQ